MKIYYKNIFKNFKNSKIIVIGDLILDRYIYGSVNRISPEAPVPVVEVSHDTFMLGGAANVAHNIISLGGTVTVVGVIGKDRQGKVLKQLLQDKNIGHAIFEDSRPTTIKTRVIAHNQQAVRFDKEIKTKISVRVAQDVLTFLNHAILEHDAIILSDYEKGMISRGFVQEIVKIAGLRKKFIAVDPKVRNFHYYKGASMIKPNLMEASKHTGVDIKDENSLHKAGRMLMNKMSCRAILITRGQEGMSLFEEHKVRDMPTVARQVYDVTGAGDTVIAAFTLAYVSGATMHEAAMMANHAAGIVVGELGTAVVNLKNLEKSLLSNGSKSVMRRSFDN